jgi:hypothetical protein
MRPCTWYRYNVRSTKVLYRYCIPSLYVVGTVYCIHVTVVLVGTKNVPVKYSPLEYGVQLYWQYIQGTRQNEKTPNTVDTRYPLSRSTDTMMNGIVICSLQRGSLVNYECFYNDNKYRIETDYFQRPRLLRGW